MVELKKKIEDLMKDNQIPFKITIYMLKQDLKQAKYHKILKNWPNLTTFEKKKKKKVIKLDCDQIITK